MPDGEVVAALDFGPATFALRHSEHFAFLNQPGDDEADSLLRESRLEGDGRFDIVDGIALPADFEVSLAAWSSGRYDLTLTANSGLDLPGWALDHSLTLARGFSAAGGEVLQGSGQLALAFDRFGGVQQVAVVYEAMPLGRVTALNFSADWPLGGGSTVTMNLNHRLAESFSEARFGLGQEVGIFDMTADLTADNAGAFGIGINFALRFGAPDEETSWSLATLLAGAPAR